MFTQIMAAFAAVGKISDLMQVLIDKFDKLSDQYIEMKKQEWIRDLHVSIEELKLAQTPEQKIKAAKELQNAIENL